MDSVTIVSSKEVNKLDWKLVLFSIIMMIVSQTVLYTMSITTTWLVNLLGIPVAVSLLILVYQTRKISYNRLTLTKKNVKGEYNRRLFYMELKDNPSLYIESNKIIIKCGKLKKVYQVTEDDILKVIWFIKRNELRCLSEDLGSKEGI